MRSSNLSYKGGRVFKRLINLIINIIVDAIVRVLTGRPANRMERTAVRVAENTRNIVAEEFAT